MKVYGEFWRRARLRRGYSQRDLSVLLGLSCGQFISNVERGRCRYTLAQTRKLIELLELKPEAVIRIIMRGEEARLRAAFEAKKFCGTE